MSGELLSRYLLIKDHDEFLAAESIDIAVFSVGNK
jgi:hypothetical protein